MNQESGLKTKIISWIGLNLNWIIAAIMLVMFVGSAYSAYVTWDVSNAGEKVFKVGIAFFLGFWVFFSLLQATAKPVAEQKDFDELFDKYGGKNDRH